MLRDIVEKATERLKALEAAKDEAMPNARRIRTLSKQAILMIHSGDIEKAAGCLLEAAGLLRELSMVAGEHPALAYYETVEAARQEHAEASILYSLVTDGRFPSPEELEVPETDYVLGLADVPGELRRRALDNLRKGRPAEADEDLQTMEDIYMHLVAAEEASVFLKGLRRKLDVIRAVNERTRAEITAEWGRRRLMDELRELGERLG